MKDVDTIEGDSSAKSAGVGQLAFIAVVETVRQGECKEVGSTPHR